MVSAHRPPPENPRVSLLPDAETFRRLVDGSAAGVGPAAARIALAGIAAPYRLAVAARNAAYDAGVLPRRGVGVPVISIGNLTLGGTGKTPLVAWAARAVMRRHHRPAIVSRGYAARRGDRSDEAAELALLLPGVPHVADRDRVAAARAAATGGAEVVLLDDGFQHRRLARDLDIVAIDATDPFGCGHLFPRGLLREPPAALARADAIVLTRALSVDAPRRAEIRRLVLHARAGRDIDAWAEAVHRPVGLRTWSGTIRPLETLAGRRVVGFAAIGNPAAFRATLAATGADVSDFLAFADHHHYAGGDLESLAARAERARADLVVTTLKDLVKVRCDALGGIPLAAVEIAIDFTGGGDLLESLVAAAAGTETSPDRNRTPPA